MSTKRGSRIYPQRGKGGGQIVPGDRTMAGSQNPNGMAGHTKSGESYPSRAANWGRLPPVVKRPFIDPDTGVAPWPEGPRGSRPRVGRQRPMKGQRGNRPSTY